ncbi:response regulator transcription factor [bacterium]|nr:response regulator transcription factor [bacterium]
MIPISVSLIEDDADIRRGLTLLLNNTPGFACTAAYGDCETALKQIKSDPPDVLLMDIQLPGMSGIEGVRRIKQILPDLDIVMLTIHDDDHRVFQSLCAGACGYLVKTTPPAKILEAIKEVHDGGAPMSAGIARMVIQSFQKSSRPELTPRELEILTQLCQGKSYKMIADALHLSKGTVHSHLKKIYKKLEVNSMTEAVIKAHQGKLV